MQGIPVTNDDESEEDEDDIDHEEVKKTHKKTKKGRQGVSAECFGKWNKKGDFAPPVIMKTEETKEKIKSRLLKSFLFQHLEPADMSIVVDAMSECRYKPGEYVIKQGENGETLYVVESGSLKCTKLFPGNSEPTFLKNYQPGEAFGELALLYNAP